MDCCFSHDCLNIERNSGSLDLRLLVLAAGVSWARHCDARFRGIFGNALHNPPPTQYPSSRGLPSLSLQICGYIVIHGTLWIHSLLSTQSLSTAPLTCDPAAMNIQVFGHIWRNFNFASRALSRYSGINSSRASAQMNVLCKEEMFGNIFTILRSCSLRPPVTF